MATKRRSRTCKYGKLKRSVKSKSGHKRRCRKSRRRSCKYGKLKRRVKSKSGRIRKCRKSRRRSCKHGKLKRSVKSKSGKVRKCKRKGKNPYFTFANKHRKNVMNKLKSKGLEGRELITKTAKELGKMYKQSQS